MIDMKRKKWRNKKFRECSMFIFLSLIHYFYRSFWQNHQRIFEPRREKTGYLHMRKQRRRSEADQRLCFRYVDSAIPILSKSEVSSR